MGKPQLTLHDERGRHGANYVRTVVETGWRAILQDFQGTNDRGLDGVVLDVHNGAVTSYQFNVQIKTSTFNSKYPGDTFPAPVSKKHLCLWRESNVPVVLICVDIGPPIQAYWTLIRPDSGLNSIIMNKQNEFGPASRDSIISEIQGSYALKISPAVGRILPIPLNHSMRKFAKAYYYQNLLGKSQKHPVYGPIEFTWKGWRHITRRGRSMQNIANSFLLLPSIRLVLDQNIFPSKWRPLKPIYSGNLIQHRTLLVFYRVVTFGNRSPAWIKVVIERQVFVPKDWALSPPDDPRRIANYKFLSVYEISRPVEPVDMN